MKNLEKRKNVSIMGNEKRQPRKAVLPRKVASGREVAWNPKGGILTGRAERHGRKMEDLEADYYRQHSAVLCDHQLRGIYAAESEFDGVQKRRIRGGRGKTDSQTD